jgi:hypothetical protein
MNRVFPASRRHQLSAISVLFAAVLASGCAQVGMGGSKSENAPAPAPAAAAAPAAATKTAAAPAPASGKIGPGMNAQGQVVDSKLVEEGYGQRIKGLGDWEGEITGKPAAGSKFTQLQIGMGMRQAMDIAGPPTDQGAYITGKAFIPWYFGSGKFRHELAYKGMGRLIFASPGGFDHTNGNLVWIIHNPTDGGYR